MATKGNGRCNSDSALIYAITQTKNNRWRGGRWGGGLPELMSKLTGIQWFKPSVTLSKQWALHNTTDVRKLLSIISAACCLKIDHLGCCSCDSKVSEPPQLCFQSAAFVVFFCSSRFDHFLAVMSLTWQMLLVSCTQRLFLIFPAQPFWYSKEGKCMKYILNANIKKCSSFDWWIMNDHF